MPKLTSLFLPMTMLALACVATSDDPSDEGAGTDGTTTGTSDTTDEGTTTSPGTTDPSADGSSSGTMVEDVPARGGIAISLVEANPGVAVPIGANGQWVGPEGRNAPLPKGRNTAVRVSVDVDDATWIQRDIEARLSVYLPDGTVEVLSEVVTIAGDSSTASLQSSFLLGVLGEWMVPGVRYQVELFEAGTGWEGLPEVDAAPSTPPEPDFVGVEDTELNMHVVMVPVDYSGPGCTQAVDPTEDALADYSDAMYQQNPLETIDIRWDDPYVVDDLDLADPNDFFTLLGRAQQYRASQAPAPNVYYYFLFDNCGECIGNGGCLLGVAADIPDASMASAPLRVAIGTRYLGSEEMGIETFVHEIGHTQGRQHVTCPGAAAGGPDPTYPYQDGLIGVWGFGVRDFQIRDADTHTDYMSYCNPTWVSDWQWNATYQRISTLTAWDAAAVEPSEPVLVGAVNVETGQAQWWTDHGGITTPTEGHTVRFWAGDELLELRDAEINHWSEGPMISVRAPLPEGYDQAVTAIEYRSPGHTVVAPRTAVADDLRPDALQR